MADETAATTTPYARIGGAPAVAALVESFYRRVLGDPDLAPFFAHSEMSKLHRMQREVFTAMLGGPASVGELDLKWAHGGRGIQREHFARFIGHLLAELEQFQLSPDDVDTMMHRIVTYKNDITGEAY